MGEGASLGSHVGLSGPFTSLAPVWGGQASGCLSLLDRCSLRGFGLLQSQGIMKTGPLEFALRMWSWWFL